MALDFPNSPSVGQLFPAVNPLWKWDGTEWAPYAFAASALGLTAKLRIAGNSLTYTPTPGMQFAFVECQAAGGGGGAGTGDATHLTGGGGGTGGAYANKWLTAAQIGASQVITVPGGTGAGATGGDCSFGALCIAKGGPGGQNGTTATIGSPGAATPAGSVGDLIIPGGMGDYAPYMSSSIGGIPQGARGGNSHLGSGAQATAVGGGGTAAGTSGLLYGGGGGGGVANQLASTGTGGAGAQGICLITEFGAFGIGPFTDMAPFEAMMSNNIVINGGMEISQENAANVITLASAAGKYICDQWQCAYTNAAAVMRGSAPSVNVANLAPGMQLQNALQLQATTAMSSVAAGDFAVMQTLLEGQRMQRLMFGTANAVPITISFWIFASVTGTASLYMRNGTGNRSYVANFTVNNVSTWEFKQITIPGDVAGTWVRDNTLAGSIGICLGVGSTFQTTPNAWQAGNFFGSSSNSNFFSVANNNVFITGVSAVVGAVGPSAAKSTVLIRPPPEELALCLRYWEKSYPMGFLPGASGLPGGFETQLINNLASATQQYGWSVRWGVPKRVAPTVVNVYSASTGAAGKIYDAIAGADINASADNVGERGCRVYSTSAAASPSVSRMFHWTADARM